MLIYHTSAFLLKNEEMKEFCRLWEWIIFKVTRYYCNTYEELISAMEIEGKHTFLAEIFGVFARKLSK